jgi:dTDP-4-dehydrorhamnose 3,5-epimerase
MNVLDVRALAIPEVKVIRVGRYRDHRGHFFESFRTSDLARHAPFLGQSSFVQGNASFSRVGTVRGMHFQWDPPMGKLVRTVHGRTIDLVLDVRPASETFGDMIALDMPASDEWADLIWVPPGFAHGNAFPADTFIEYLCTAEYNAMAEETISPLAADINWSTVDTALAAEVRSLFEGALLITEKDRTGMSIGHWARDPRSSSPVFSSDGLRWAR